MFQSTATIFTSFGGSNRTGVLDLIARRLEDASTGVFSRSLVRRGIEMIFTLRLPDLEDRGSNNCTKYWHE